LGHERTIITGSHDTNCGPPREVQPKSKDINETSL
jgi:hypothetical protein